MHFTGNLGEDNTLTSTGVDTTATPGDILVPNNEDIVSSAQARLPLYDTEHMERDD